MQYKLPLIDVGTHISLTHTEHRQNEFKKNYNFGF